MIESVCDPDGKTSRRSTHPKETARESGRRSVMQRKLSGSCKCTRPSRSARVLQLPHTPPPPAKGALHSSKAAQPTDQNPEHKKPPSHGCRRLPNTLPTASELRRGACMHTTSAGSDAARRQQRRHAAAQGMAAICAWQFKRCTHPSRCCRLGTARRTNRLGIKGKGPAQEQCLTKMTKV